MEFIPVAIMAALIAKLVDFGKALSNRDGNAAVTQLVAWAAGVLTVILFARSDFANGITYGGVVLENMNLWSQIIVGMAVSSVASVANDVRQSLDSTVQTNEKHLLPNAPRG